MAITPPPSRRKEITDNSSAAQTASERNIERKMEKIISLGSSTVGSGVHSDVQEPTIKSFSVRIMSDRLDVVNDLRNQRPRRPMSPKPGISLQDWVLEAIEEKIKKEQKG